MPVTEINKTSNRDVVEVLEEALAMAKSGEIIQVSVSWVNAGKGTGGQHSSGGDAYSAWVALEHHSRAYYDNVIRGY